jgi:hypothetical protein
MKRYSILGGVLGSDIEFPEVTEATPGDLVDWRFEQATGPLAAPGDGPVRVEELDEGVTVSLRERDGVARLTYSDTGTFVVSADGSRIRWTPSAGDVRMEDVCADVLGRVMAIALQYGGALALHGSAAAVDDGVLAFLAPKFHGKTTTALALVDAGARLVADDLVAVRPGPPATVLPGVPSARLWPSAAERLTVASNGRLTPDRGFKLALDALPAAYVVNDERPLLACYLLDPQNESGGAITRSRLASLPAALALTGQAKMGRLFGAAHATRLLDLAVAVAMTVPVYRLSLPRALERLPEVAAQLFDWHGGGVAARR